MGAADSKAPSRAQAEARPGIETQRQQGQQKAQASLDGEAMAAIAEPEGALTAVAKKDKKETLSAMERATGKLNILLARNQKTALIAVKVEVEVADNAPAGARRPPARHSTSCAKVASLLKKQAQADNRGSASKA